MLLFSWIEFLGSAALHGTVTEHRLSSELRRESLHCCLIIHRVPVLLGPGSGLEVGGGIRGGMWVCVCV